MNQSERTSKSAHSSSRAIPYAVPSTLGLSLAILALSGCGQPTVLTTKAVRQQPVVSTSVTTEPLQEKVQIWLVKANKGEIDYVAVDRMANSHSLKDTVAELLKGPTDKEASSGISSEIPKDTSVIDVKDSADGIELNLSKQFASDGGIDSIQTRLEQLRRTVSQCEHVKSVYLDVDGNRLSEAGGEGLEVKQPINL
jgi:spore germination protein GerM